MNLAETYEELRGALAPLGVDVGREVLDLWRDRVRHSQDALPAHTLARLAQFATRLLEQAGA